MDTQLPRSAADGFAHPWHAGSQRDQALALLSTARSERSA
jgi:hypothetical protein